MKMTPNKNAKASEVRGNNRRDFLKTVGVCSAGMLVAPVNGVIFGTSTLPKKTNPNIILVLADDLGYEDVGFTGNRVIDTPHLDKFAEENAESICYT